MCVVVILEELSSVEVGRLTQRTGYYSIVPYPEYFDVFTREHVRYYHYGLILSFIP